METTTPYNLNYPDPAWDYADIFLRLQVAIATLQKIETDMAKCEVATDNTDRDFMDRFQSVADTILDIKYSI